MKAFLCGLVVTVIAGGCFEVVHSMEATKRPTGQNSPQEVARKMDAALRDKDWVAYQECNSWQKEDEEVLRVTFDYASSVYEFREVVLEMFGEEGWNELRNPDADEKVTLDLPPRKDKWINDLVVQEADGGALIENPWTKQKEMYVKNDGVWKRDLFSRIPNEEARHSVKVLLGRFHVAINKGIKMVKERESSIEEVRAAVAKAMVGL